MSSSTLIQRNTHAVRGRPTLKDVERFRNGSVRELKVKPRDNQLYEMDEWTDYQQSKMESSCSIFVPFVVNAMIFLIVVLIYTPFFCI